MLQERFVSIVESSYSITTKGEMIEVFEDDIEAFKKYPFWDSRSSTFGGLTISILLFIPIWTYLITDEFAYALLVACFSIGISISLRGYYEALKSIQK